MIYGIGTDIVKVARIQESLGRFGERFARRVLTDAEFLEYQASHQPERFVAKHFAAKYSQNNNLIIFLTLLIFGDAGRAG